MQSKKELEAENEVLRKRLEATKENVEFYTNLMAALNDKIKRNQTMIESK